MKPTFYPRLAWMGIKKNARLYVPYLLSCAFMAAMLYVIAYLAVTPALYTVNGKVNGSGTSAVAMTMSLGSFVVSVFIALFLFYTNSFLLRRRKKEFGLYSVLGMDRGALSAILFWETLLAAAFTLIAGLGLGLLLSYVSQSALLRLLSLPAAAFTVSLAAIKQCAITFIAIFALLYVRGVLSLRHAQGAALLKSENVGEKPPKSQWLLVIPGLALLLGAYYIAATINDPVQAMLLFFLAVIMVILSTYLLFISGSVTLCKTLQKDEKFYYKKRNFVSLSSLTYRMKRNGAGLASICILSTMVLVMLASTASLYFGAEDAINTLAVQNHWHPTEMADVRAEFFSLYGSLFFLGILLSVLFLFATLLMLYYKQVVEGYEDAALLYVRGVLSLRHAQGAALLKSENVGEKPPKSQWLLVIPGLALLLGAYYIAATINDPVQAMLLFFLAVIMVILSTYLLFISGSVTLCKTLQKDEKFYYKKRNFVSLSSLTYRMKRNGAGLASICILSTMVLVMLASTASLYFGAEDAINTLAVQNHWHPTEMADVRAEFFSLYGSLFFLGILLSVLFLFATLLMLYYKQVVEGYEDASRFAIMQRVGMTKRDIRESVNAQMLLIFLLPLAAAALHLAFAQPMVWQIMQLFGIQNLTLFLGVTGAALLLFALLYCAMYRLTSNAYFRIVSTGGAAA